MNDTKMTGMELRATWGLGTVFSLRMLGMFMVLPVLTTYGMALQGASESLIGLAIGIYGLAQAIFQIPFGLVSDRVGRKPLIVGGLLVFALGSAIAALTDNIWGVILGRALQGSGAIAAAVMALLSDLTREQNRTKAMAFIGVSFGVTFAIAMVVGPIVTHAIGLNGLFWGITALALAGVVLTLLVVPTVGDHTLNRESGIVRGSVGKVLANPQLLKLNMGIFYLHAMLMSSFVALPPMMAGAGFLPSEQWKVYLITMLVSFAAVVPAIIYAEVKRHMKRVFLGCVTLLLFAELVLLAAGNHLWVMFAGIQLFFLAFNVMEALLPSLISKESPAGYKGTAMGVYSTSQFLGVAFGGTLGGFLFQLQGAWLVFLAGAVIALAWWGVSATLREPPYVSSLRIALPGRAAADSQLAQRLQAQPGVTEVVVVPEERSAYVKVDTKQTNRAALEKAVAV
ncbi:MFS transporter [Sodalis praecaptivus]|uniref:MFS transporter n=1 Tax=Sodalis praecaptivus TaxID=1239307 RepID=UPI0027FBAE52|nr:MFS transporter [Sodalis praecaptivus]CAJ0991366.1 Inner membrane transport protein YajR [Sodalis praecaptivus]